MNNVEKDVDILFDSGAGISVMSKKLFPELECPPSPIRCMGLEVLNMQENQLNAGFLSVQLGRQSI